MTNQPFFTRDRDAFIPTQAANGPWDPKSLHGRVIIGLLAFVIEQRHGADGFVPARLTVDMFRLPGFAPIEVKSRVIRDGLRIKVVEAEFVSGGVSMARASCPSCCGKPKIRKAMCGRRRTGTCPRPRTFPRPPIPGSA
jgi:hypothetical protein